MFEGLLQPTHLIIILVIVLIVFGPGKLPEIGGALGKSMSEFKRSVKGPGEEDSPSATAAAAGTCPQCKQENPAGTKFCGHCGAKIA